MSVGATLTKVVIDEWVAKQTKDLNVLLGQIGEMQSFLAGKTEGDLTDLGYTAGDVAVLKSAYIDLDELRRIYEGDVALAEARDFRTFARRLFGLGF